jgi:hypothetical protein
VSYETEFDEFMTDKIVRRPYTGRDDYGKAQVGSPVTVMGRVVYKPELVRTNAGGGATNAVREVVAKARVYFSGVPGWGMSDQITLPDGTSPAILAIPTYPDEDGEHHQVVIV